MISYSEKNLPLVVIFGRTNVGKSTLFNLLAGKKQALTSNIAGTTRDANRAVASWRGRDFLLFDTGGIIDPSGLFDIGRDRTIAETAGAIQKKIERQALAYLSRADLILFLADYRSGLLPDDRQMALVLQKILKEKKGKILLVINKVDGARDLSKISEFHRLALGAPSAISAVTGSGTGDLLDLVVKKLPRTKTKAEVEPAVLPEPAAKPDSEIKAVIIGKPNVGKSSLLNRLLGEERVIVSPLPHTTREPQDTLLSYRTRSIRLIDTAGISRRGGQKIFKEKEENKLIKYGIAKSLGKLKQAEIVLLVLDIHEALTHQDARIIEEIIDAQKSLIIIANKWDLVPEKDAAKFTDYIYGKLPFAGFAPVIFFSALKGGKTGRILDLIIEVSQQRKKSLSPSQLNSFMMRLVKLHRPAKGKGTRPPRIHGFEQAHANPPRFSVRIGSKEDLHFSYVRFISNRLREKFGFLGTPIKIEVVKNKRVHGSHN